MKKMSKVAQLIYGVIVGLSLYYASYKISMTIASKILDRIKAKKACKDWEDEYCKDENGEWHIRPYMDEEFAE